MRILLVEDEDFIRDLYKRQFDHAGIPLDAFPLGKDGLAAVKQTPYDIILLDIMLPDTNGLQILKEVKQNEQTKHIPVILLTNLSQDMIIKEGFELGAEGYLVKAAYTPDQIVQEVKNMLARKQAGGQPVAVPTPGAAAAPQSGGIVTTPPGNPSPQNAAAPMAPAADPTATAAPVAPPPATPQPTAADPTAAPTAPTPATTDLQTH